MILVYVRIQATRSKVSSFPDRSLDNQGHLFQGLFCYLRDHARNSLQQGKKMDKREGYVSIIEMETMERDALYEEGCL